MNKEESKEPKSSKDLKKLAYEVLEEHKHDSVLNQSSRKKGNAMREQVEEGITPTTKDFRSKSASQAKEEWLKNYQETVYQLCSHYVDTCEDNIIYPMDETEMGMMRLTLEERLKDYIKEGISLALKFPSDIIHNTDIFKGQLINCIDWEWVINGIYMRTTFSPFMLEYPDCTRSFFGYKGEFLFIANTAMSSNITSRVKGYIPMNSEYVIGYVEKGYQAYTFYCKTTHPIALIMHLERSHTDWDINDPLNVNNLLLRLKRELRHNEFATMSVCLYPEGCVESMDF